MGNVAKKPIITKEDDHLNSKQSHQQSHTGPPAMSIQFTLPGDPSSTLHHVKHIDLTEEQKIMLQESWKLLEKDITQVGIIVFINLFDSHPDLQSAFLPFTGIVLEDLKKSKLLREHALRVMGAVQKSVGRLHEPDKLDIYLRELGRKHNKNGAKLEYIDYIGPQFISAIRPSLASQWTPELEQSWTLLLAKIGNGMKESMLEARQEEEEEERRQREVSGSSSETAEQATSSAIHESD